MKKLILLIMLVLSIASFFGIQSVAAQNSSTIDPSVLIEGGPDYLSKEYQEQIKIVNKLVEAYIKEKGLLDPS